MNQTMKLGIIFLLMATLINSDMFTSSSEVPESANNIKPLLIGADVPEVTLKNIDGKDVNLREEVLKKPTVLIFYRGGWCPYCNMHLSDLMKIENDLKELGYQIIAVSADKYEKLAETFEKNEVGYTLLSDNDVNAAKAFGIAFKVEQSYLEKAKKYNIDLEEESGRSHHILPVPSAYVINKEGKIYFSYVNPDYSIRVDGDLLLQAAKSALKGN